MMLTRMVLMSAMAANCCVLPVCVYAAEHLLGAFLFDTPRARPEDRVPMGTITMFSKAEVRATSSVVHATQLAYEQCGTWPSGPATVYPHRCVVTKSFGSDVWLAKAATGHGG